MKYLEYSHRNTRKDHEYHPNMTHPLPWDKRKVLMISVIHKQEGLMCEVLGLCNVKEKEILSKELHQRIQYQEQDLRIVA